MSLLGDVGDYASSQAGLTQGTNLFLGFMPPAPDAASCIYETGGRSPIKAMTNTPGRAHVEQPSVQIVTRGAVLGYEDARATAQALFLIFDGFPTRQINGRTYFWGSARQSPFLMAVEEDGRPLIAFNVDLACAMSTST
jgi:hypothetical protein